MLEFNISFRSFEGITDTCLLVAEDLSVESGSEVYSSLVKDFFLVLNTDDVFRPALQENLAYLFRVTSCKEDDIQIRKSLLDDLVEMFGANELTFTCRGLEKEEVFILHSISVVPDRCYVGLNVQAMA